MLTKTWNSANLNEPKCERHNFRTKIKNARTLFLMGKCRLEWLKKPYFSTIPLKVDSNKKFRGLGRSQSFSISLGQIKNYLQFEPYVSL